MARALSATTRDYQANREREVERSKRNWTERGWEAEDAVVQRGSTGARVAARQAATR
jgi:hypothetical protein